MSSSSKVFIYTKLSLGGSIVILITDLSGLIQTIRHLCHCKELQILLNQTYEIQTFGPFVKNK